MFTLLLFIAGAALVVDEAARELGALVKLAIKRADLTQDQVARFIGVPIPKLSDQLNGKVPFTSLWRFFVAPEMRETDFVSELLGVLAPRVNLALVSQDIGDVLAGLTELLHHHRKPMAKASLGSRSVITLPLRGSQMEAEG